MRGFLGISRNSLITATIITLGLSAIAAFPQEETGKEKSLMKEPSERLSVTLSVYSGRPNPQWSITAQHSDFDKLIELIGSLRFEDKPLFKYEKWNRLGYASFWIFSRNIKGLPKAVHVWRDMAYMAGDRGSAGGYAIGSAKIYDILVGQAEMRGHKEFFVKYREHQRK